MLYTVFLWERKWRTAVADADKKNIFLHDRKNVSTINDETVDTYLDF